MSLVGSLYKGTARQRGYSASSTNRLNSGFIGSNLSANEEIRRSLLLMRNRSRELAMNNDYVKGFLALLTKHVIGPGGIQLQNKAKDPSGTQDRWANNIIEAEWGLWGRKENCSVDGRMTWHDIQKLCIRGMARDGEVLLRKVRGYKGSRHRFALRMLAPDHLDHNLNSERGGNTIKMGVEQNEWGRVVAYHLFVKHPGDNVWGYGKNLYERVPAEEIIHLFLMEHPEQVRGVPWIYTAINRLNMLGAYEEAELVAARIGASKMGFYTANGQEYTGDAKDEKDNPIMEVEPGIFERLPAGWDFKPFDPQHPAGNYQPFVKAMLRGISVGCEVSYNSLSSDLEGVNFSSIRQGVLEERDTYRMLQTYLKNHLCPYVYEPWLAMQLLTGAIPLPMAKFDKFNAPVWQSRGWTWVDPQKDVNAAIMAINAGLKTRAQVVAEGGFDFEDVVEQLAHEQDLAKQHGLTFDQKGILIMEGASSNDNQNNQG